MNYEEKYKQALERARKELRVCGSQDCDAARQIFRFFPELNVSEDERIKREILELVSIACNGNQFEEIKDWLEKQNNNKVEPKFHEGDWVIHNYNILKIKCVGNTHYCFETVGGYVDDMLVSEIDSQFHLWTINDAKDGDLIYVSTEVKGVQAIFHKFENGIIYFHCNLCSDFTQGGYEPSGDVSFVMPLPKIHYQSFFQKMKEAGYEWDSEKKELVKIIPKKLDADEVIEWMEKHIIEWKGQDLIKTFTPNSPAGKSYTVEQFKKDFGL